MIVIEKENETTFLNDKAIIDCTFYHEPGTVNVRLPGSYLNYYKAERVAYIPDGDHNGTVEYETNKESNES